MATWNGVTPFNAQETCYGNNGLIVPRYIATRTFTISQFTTATPTVLISGSPSWYVGGIDIVLGAGTSIATATNVGVTIQSGSTNLFTVGIAIPVTPTTTFLTAYANYNMNLFARTLNDPLQFILNRTFLTGSVLVTAYYSLAPADTVGL